jgi:hypothetical protein
VFTRRRCIAVKIDGSGVAVHLPGWTIVGHERPDGSGEYYYYHNDGNESFASSDFNDPRAKG